MNTQKKMSKLEPPRMTDTPKEEDLLIKPKKLNNPVKADSIRTELHRELKFNQKM